MTAFIATSPAPFTRAKILPQTCAPQSRPSSTGRITPTAAQQRPRSPITRLFNTLFFFSPFGKMIRGPTPASAPPARRQRSQIYLITGASGGTGRRVVRDLLAGNKHVRALTRSRASLDAALTAVGVDIARVEREGRLSVVITDLFNVPPEAFDNVKAIVSCTGSRVGPREDPDRSKYFQGRVFYPPIIKEDTPENVEYIGVKRVAEMAASHFAAQTPLPGKSVIDVTDAAQWGALDDVVMGGVSESGVRSDGTALIFSGKVSTANSGGFSSVRTANMDTPLDLSEYDGIILRVRGDGKSYKMILRCEQKWDGNAHCRTIETKRGEWCNIPIAFSEMNTVFRGKSVADGPKVNPAKIFAWQVMLSKFEYDGALNPRFSAGEFELRIAAVHAYKKAELEDFGPAPVATGPKFVHVCSALVTQPFIENKVLDKKGEIPPIVQLNAQLGGLLNWKLAGEDAIRTAGLPYCIARCCALTEERPVGLAGLKFRQGDRMVGAVSRNDVSTFVIQAFGRKELIGVTLEIANIEDGDDLGETVDGQLRVLRKDSDIPRSFAPLPYVPEPQVVSNS